MPNNRYKRGARAERELLHIFYDRGWSVIRSSGSGVNALSPDVIFLKNKDAICVECKAWNRGSLSLDPEQFEKLLEWEKNTAFPTFVGWRVNNKGWYFIRLDEFSRGRSNYNVTMKRVFEINRVIGSILPVAADNEDAGRTRA
ncbi:MAG: hypothetical protein M1569_00985 [Candidatus Marsarchaeota archaeon]|nr:hypothetical protein [Candidatus Marsarchaeota archaeon]MCL5412962.1 hypothetical protein [Candidatus Marsarchaeota archaeon]